MARKRYSDDDAFKISSEIDVYLHDGLDVVDACHEADVSDKTYYYWRKKSLLGWVALSSLSCGRFRRRTSVSRKLWQIGSSIS